MQALLCERCGYDLSGSPAGGVCPECELPVSESLPERRTGTAWQQAWIGAKTRLPQAWLLSTVRGLFTPGAQLRRATIVARGARGLLWINLLIASTVLTLQSAPTVAALTVSYWPSWLTSPAVALGPTWRYGAVLLTLALWALLLRFLVGVERFGIHFYAARRFWRIGSVLSLLGTSHASGAWIVAALGARMLPIATEGLARILPPSLAVKVAGIQVIAPALGFISGMIWFEIATYFALRACRYGNHPGVHRPDA
ncbi:MAG: hypothetical protein JSS51_12255 [Planctomycetes bacterium]|nr:hypothetical protein [Planctomycetota bacterium]